MQYTPAYSIGELDVASAVAKGLIGELLVARFLKLPDSSFCNLAKNFKYKYDMVDMEYGRIDVKSPCKNCEEGWT